MWVATAVHSETKAWSACRRGRDIEWSTPELHQRGESCAVEALREPSLTSEFFQFLSGDFEMIRVFVSESGSALAFFDLRAMRNSSPDDTGIITHL